MKGYISRIFTSFVDVPDKISIAVYFSGCSIRCKGCQNKEYWNLESGTEMDGDEIFEKIKKSSLAEYVAFLGGEPTDQMDLLIYLCKRIVKEIKKPIAIYTGREFEVLPNELLNNVKLLVCGPYREDLLVKDRWPASLNQRVFIKEGNQWKC
ncbi:4Fe-4S cluster-binding domain-containing protein [Candidatus Dependentiae bacterium]|nr:4Fe-4S cluster-binding domain-containing protein [Candidatus Dependentiae bacterium]